MPDKKGVLFFSFFFAKVISYYFGKQIGFRLFHLLQLILLSSVLVVAGVKDSGQD